MRETKALNFGSQCPKNEYITWTCRSDVNKTPLHTHDCDKSLPTVSWLVSFELLCLEKMNFSKDKKPTSDILSISGSVKRETGGGGGSSLSMYNSPPDGTVEFEEFATLALERFTGTCFPRQLRDW